jgi:hypothetical protein
MGWAYWASFCPYPGHENFSFFTFFFQLNFSKYTVRKKIAKLYIWRREGRRQGPTAVPTVVGVRSLFNNLYFLFALG